MTTFGGQSVFTTELALYLVTGTTTMWLTMLFLSLTSVVDIPFYTPVSLYLIIVCAVCTMTHIFFSILNSLFGELTSKNVLPTKTVADILSQSLPCTFYGLGTDVPKIVRYDFLFPQSGSEDFDYDEELEKFFRRDSFIKNNTSHLRERDVYRKKLSKRTWTSKQRIAAQKFKTADLDPHAGNESIQFALLREQAKTMGVVLPGDVWTKVEGVVLLAAAMAECTSSTQALSISLLYLKTHYSEALVEKVAGLLHEMFTEDDDVLEPHGGHETPDWLGALRSGMVNWRLATTNPVFKKISYLISICVTLGLCEAGRFEWNIRGVKAFCIPALDRHFGAIDLIDAAVETVLYFVEGGHACFTHGSLAPLLFSDHLAREFDEEYTFLTANLEHVRTGNLQKLAKVDENDYDRRLTKAIATSHDLYTTATGTWEKKLFFDRRAKLNQMKTTFDAIRVQGGLRVAPFTVNFFGKSAVGKSSVSAISMVMGLLANGFSADDEMMATLNEGDKFMSNYRSFICGLFIDDIGNTKPDFVERAPTNKIVEICNNVRQYANMAEADLKGKVSLEPKFVNLTTNVKDLGASKYSSEPVSIARRAHLTVTVEVKKEFCSHGFAGSVGQQLDSEKVAKFYTDSDGIVEIPLVPDLWELTIERVVPVSTPGTDVIGYELETFEGKPTEKVDIHTYIRFMIERSRQHFVQQERLVAQTSNLASRVAMCACGTPRGYCKCVDTQSGVIGYVLGAAIGTVTTKATTLAGDYLHKEGTILERMATKKLLKYSQDMENFVFFQWTNLIPEAWLHHKWGKRFVLYARREEVLKDIRREFMNAVLLSLFCVALAYYVSSFFFLPIAFIGYRARILAETVQERLYDEIAQRNDAMPHAFKKVRDNQLKYVLAALGSVAALYTLLKVWQGFRNADKETQGNLAPTTPEEVAVRDAESNPWANAVVEPIPTTTLSQTSTATEVLDKVHKNQVFLRIKQHDGNRVSGAIFVKSNVLLMPYHMWFVDAKTTTPLCEDMEVEIMRSERENTGSTFRAYFSSNCMVHIPDTDFCVVWVPNGGSYRDLTSLLPLAAVKGGLSSMVFRNGTGIRVDANANITPGMVGHSERSFLGAHYNLSIPTFRGLCMATFVTRGKACVIAGFHLGGKTGTKLGVLGTVTQAQVAESIRCLSLRRVVVLAKSEGTMNTKVYDKEFFEGPEVHFKSPVNFLEEGTNFRIFGAVGGSVSPHSNVTTTVISNTVAEVCGVPQKWGPPAFKPSWKPWQTSLSFSSRPSIGVEGNALEWALEDYICPLLKMVKQRDWVARELAPLSRMQTVCGIDGKRFIDKMSPKTSVGFPLTGPKSKYMTLLDPEHFPDQMNPVELDDQFWLEFERIQGCYRSDERAYPVFKGCLKDEATPINKDKVRVFQAAPIALQLLVRMYFLPIGRFLSVNPLVSECAVGINAQGPEWNEFQDSITRFGKDRIFAGDYSKYDLRMPAQVMFAAFRILIDLAVASGNYTEDDLSIMRGIATDICYPVMAYNGTLLQLIGSNPSGQNLTVYINSIVNSLLVRSGFHSIVGPVPDFRLVVALGTYGDDVKGSVKTGYDAFNHIAYADYMAEHDMKFTMPDKTSTPVHYMLDEDADFLKRKNIWNTDVNLYFGALDEDSIFKSLHCTSKSKFLTADEQACENIDGAIREWFSHGREIYELRRQQMNHVADRHNLICRETDIDYDTRLTSWKDKYLPKEE